MTYGLEDLARDLGQRHPPFRADGAVDRALALGEGSWAGGGVQRHHADRTFVDADRAADALANLDRELHHPGEGAA
jgi:hypothetical protein